MIRSFLQIGLSGIINIIIGLITTPIITRIIDPVDLGRFSIVNGYIGIISTVSLVGLNAAFSRFLFEYKQVEGRRKLFKICLLVPLFVSTLLCIIFLFINKTKKIIDYLTITEYFVIVLIVISTIMNRMILLLLATTLNSKAYSIVLIVQKVSYSLGVIALFLLLKNKGLLIILIATAISLILPNIIGIKSSKEYWQITKVGTRIDIREVIEYSLPYFVYNGLYSVYETLDRLLIESNCGDYELGIYTSISSIVGLITIFQTAFATIWEPEQTKHYIENSDDTTFLSKGNKYITIIMMFAGINMIMFKDVICLFLGEKYRAGINLFPFLLFVPIINTLIPTVTSGIDKQKKSVYRVVIITISIISMYIFSHLLLPTLGIKGVIIGYAISLLVQYFLTAIISNKLYRVDYGFKEFIFITIIFTCLCITNTFFNSLIVNILIYITSIVTLYILYKVEIKEIVGFILNNKK